MFEDSIDDVPLGELGDRICELSAHIAASTYRVAAAARGLRPAQRMGRLGREVVRPLAELEVRTRSPFSAREAARSARARPSAAHLRGVRARSVELLEGASDRTRIATPDSEEHLLAFARQRDGVARREARPRRTDVPLPADDADADLRHERRHLTYRYLEDGSIEFRARLDPEEGALVLAAIEKVQDELRIRNRVDGNATDGSAEPPHDPRYDAALVAAGAPRTARARRLPAVARASLAAAGGRAPSIGRLARLLSATYNRHRGAHGETVDRSARRPGARARYRPGRDRVGRHRREGRRRHA